MTIKTNRSNTYQFTIQSKNDPSLQQLKNEIKQIRNQIKQTQTPFESFNKSYISLPYVRIRARGPRKNQYSKYHTLMKNATHYDIYVNYIDIEINQK